MKIVSNGLNIGFHYEPEWKTQYIELTLLKRKTSQVHKSVKETMLTVFWDMRGSINTIFMKKVAAITNSFYCQLLMQKSPYLLNDSLINLLC